jgi:hypothetical protein
LFARSWCDWIEVKAGTVQFDHVGVYRSRVTKTIDKLCVEVCEALLPNSSQLDKKESIWIISLDTYSPQIRRKSLLGIRYTRMRKISWLVTTDSKSIRSTTTERTTGFHVFKWVQLYPVSYVSD